MVVPVDDDVIWRGQPRVNQAIVVQTSTGAAS
jgi:hypothetical protein